MTTGPSLEARGGSAPPRAGLDHYLLGGADGDVALVDGATSLTYADLRAAVGERSREHQGAGPLVLPIGNDLDSVIAYLAALALHRPVALVEAGTTAPRRCREVGAVIGCTDPSAPAPHPDLALLLSTSGSTGSPKLARLSRDNLLANARSIADYLDLQSTDCAITSLPLHYCYGLSVLHSHLLVGATVVLTDRSVADEAFWQLATDRHVTGLAGVPYTFDLLAASGFADRELPSLRYVTQAGGRLDADRVRALAELGQSRGWDLYVMYGQTEATARITYLPPELAHRRPESVGVPVPGGSVRVHRPDASGVGELVYAGPNVMMGYAVTPADLARGADHAELFTGDLARIGRDGLVEVVGRRDRVVKVFGVRLDLDRVEQDLADVGPGFRLCAEGDVVHLFTERSRSVARLQAGLRRHGLPTSAVHVHRVAALPRTSAGKVDDGALRVHARRAGSVATAPPSTATTGSGTDRGTGTGTVSAEAVRDLYAVLLGRPDAVLDDSFVSLGGDSLSYVELSSRLAALLDHLPRAWPSLTARELAAGSRATQTSRRSLPLEVGVVLRALAILIVVVTHVDLVLIPGGAHLLLAVAGYHLARFTLSIAERRLRTRRILAAVASVAVPSSLWIAGSTLATGDYHWTTALYLNGARSYRREGGLAWTLDWQFWFLEAIVWGFLAVAAFLAIPAVDRWHRRAPFAVAAGVVVVTTALRYLTVGVEGDGVERYAVPSVLFVLALGWAAAEARSQAQRVAVLAASSVGLYGYFGDRQRELIVVATIALLLWLRPIRVPVPAARVITLLASSSLWIYLTHWQVYPEIEAAGHPVLALVASLVVGVVAHRAYQRWVLTPWRRIARAA